MERGEERGIDERTLIKNKIIEKVQKNIKEEKQDQKDEVKCDHCEVEEVVERNKILEKKYNETFESLNKVRRVVLELSEEILEKEFRITHLEKNLHEGEKKIKQMRDSISENKEKWSRVRLEYNEEKEILENQIKRLSEIIKEKDSRILGMNKDNCKFMSEDKELKKKNKELMSQLEVTCNNLSTIVKETTEREKMMNNLESELKKKQMERQGLYLNEINRNKRMYINIKVKENLMTQIIKDKNNQISTLSREIEQLREKLEKISITFKELSITNYDTNHQTLAISNTTRNNVQCTVSSPCNMKVVKGTAKITI